MRRIPCRPIPKYIAMLLLLSRSLPNLDEPNLTFPSYTLSISLRHLSSAGSPLDLWMPLLPPLISCAISHTNFPRLELASVYPAPGLRADQCARLSQTVQIPLPGPKSRPIHKCISGIRTYIQFIHQYGKLVII